MQKQMLVAAACAAAIAAGAPAAAQSYSPSRTYPNPDGDMNSVRSRGPCVDPWVTIALEMVNGRADPALCAPALYRGGSWGSFNDLIHAVYATKSRIGVSTLRVLPVQGKSYNMIGVFQGGNLVAAGGGNLVAAGGGNLVAAGGGNMVSIQGGRLVTTGGGNLAPVATVRQGYGLQSGRSIALPSGGIGF